MALESLEISATRSTPSIVLDAATGVFMIKGDSYPEDAAAFFEPVIAWVKAFQASSPTKKIVVEVDLNYINSSSTKCLLIFFDVLQEVHREGPGVEVRWYFDEENDVSQEIGEEFKDDYEIPFTFHAYVSDRSEASKAS